MFIQDENVRRAEKITYLTNSDKKDISTLVYQISTAISEDAVVRIARQIINISARNKKIDNHEAMIDTIMKFIQRETKRGMIFRFVDMEKFVYKTGYESGYPHYGGRVIPANATRFALDRLVKSGYLKRVRLCREKKGYKNIYYNGYEVV